MTKSRWTWLLIFLAFAGLAVFLLKFVKDVPVQAPLPVPQPSSREEVIPSSFWEVSSSSSEPVSSLDAVAPSSKISDTSEEFSPSSSSQDSMAQSALPEKGKEDFTLSQRYKDFWEKESRYGVLYYYLRKHLNDNVYSSMSFLSDDYTQPQTLEIWAVDLETVQKELDEYAKTEKISDLSISIQPARYSREVLLPIRDAINKFADERYEQDGTMLINYSRVLKDFIYISAPQKTEELNNFLKEHGFQDYVEIEVAIVIVPNA